MRATDGPLSGRRGEAARNDGRILDAAREVFLTDPDAPVAAVANRAGVGISALYRRYDNKEDLLRELARDALTRYVGDLQAALSDDRDPWTVYRDYLIRVVDGGSQALAQRLAWHVHAHSRAGRTGQAGPDAGRAGAQPGSAAEGAALRCHQR